MKSKNLAFLLLVGLIAPSAVMSAGSSTALTPDTEGVSSKKIAALTEKTINLQRSIQGKEDNTDYQPPAQCDVISKSLKNVLKLLDYIPHVITYNFKKERTVIEGLFMAYARLHPDSWDNDLNQLWNADSIKNLKYLILQDIQNCVNKISKKIGLRIKQSDKNAKFHDLMEEMGSLTENVKTLTKAKTKLFKGKYIAPMIDPMIVKDWANKCSEAQTKREDFIKCIVSVRDADPKELALTQKNILDSIETILDYIENYSKENYSEQGPKQDQKEEEKRTE